MNMYKSYLFFNIVCLFKNNYILPNALIYCNKHSKFLMFSSIEMSVCIKKALNDFDSKETFCIFHK